MNALLLVVLAQWQPGLVVQDEGVTKGSSVTTIDCVGAGVTCSVAGAKATLNATGGGGGSGLPADPAPCPASQWVRDQDASGVLSCTQPAWGDVAFKPATFAPSAHTHAGGDVTSAVATATAASTAAALAANAGNCGAGEAAQGVDAAGAAEGCFTPPGTYALPDATSLVTGGVRLTGDFGGTAISPTVPALANKAATVTCGANAWASTLGAASSSCTQPGFGNLSGSLTLGQMPSGTGFLKASGGTPTYQSIVAADLPDATGAAKGAIVLTGDLGGTAASPTVVDDSHAHTTTTISGLDASNDFTAGVLPGARGGLGAAQPTCAGTDKVTCNGTTCTCAADVGGTYTLPAATATVLGGVKGTGTALVCSGSDKMTGFAADGTMQCSTDLTGGAGSSNFVEVDVDFGATESNDLASTVVTGQAWVTATSKITCAPTMLATSSRAEGAEDAVIEGLVAAVHTRVAGTGFTLTVASVAGLGTTGVYKIHCTGG